MNILEEIYKARISFVRANHREPDRLILTDERYCGFMSTPVEKLRYLLSPDFDHCMGMLIVRTSAKIPGGLEVR